MDLKGHRAVITGASRGIGAATARLFARLGADVAVHFRRGEAEAMGVVSDVREAGAQAVACRADLSSWDAGEGLLGGAERALGAIDVVVVNHGLWKEAPIDAMTAADYDETLDANLRGIFSVCGAAARRMKARGAGRIVLVSSTAGQRGEARHAHYAATKGAVISVTKSLAAELAPWGIRVNCVAPGWVATDMTERTLHDQGGRDAVLATIPLGRVASPEEIAWPIAFLASDVASFVTGEILNVNGGAVLVG